MKSAANAPFAARLVALDGKKLEKFDIPDQKTADEIEARIKASRYTVKSVESKPARRNPNPPFTTSTIQQEASRKLGFSASRTMQVAQRLYEGIDDRRRDRPASSPICEPTACTIVPEAINARPRHSSSTTNTRQKPTSPPSARASTRPRPRTHRKRTRPSAPPTSRRKPKSDVARYLDKDQAPPLRTHLEARRREPDGKPPQSSSKRRPTIEVEGQTTAKPITLRATGSVIQSSTASCKPLRRRP